MTSRKKITFDRLFSSDNFPYCANIDSIRRTFVFSIGFSLSFAFFLGLFYAISLRIYFNWISNKRNGFIFHLLQWLRLVTILKLNNKFYRWLQFNILTNPSNVSMSWNWKKKPLERKLCVCVSHFAYIQAKKYDFHFI